jgi:hypothetical protein
MERLMYEKVVLDGDIDARTFLRCLSLREMHVEFAQTRITSLFLIGDLEPSTLFDLLTICKGVTCLALALETDEFVTDGSALWSALDDLPLRSLMLAVTITFTDAITTSPNAFTRITHLDIHDGSLLGKDHKCFDTLTALTHLCAVLDTYNSEPLVIKRFVSNVRLQVLALRAEGPHHRAVEFLEEHELLHDKIVLMPFIIAPWGLLGQGDMLLWQLAEEALKRPIVQTRELLVPI